MRLTRHLLLPLFVILMFLTWAISTLVEATPAEAGPSYNFSHLAQTPVFKVESANSSIHTTTSQRGELLVGGVFRVTLSRAVDVGVKDTPANVFVNAVIASCASNMIVVIQSQAFGDKGRHVTTSSEVLALTATSPSTPAFVIYRYLCDGNTGQRRYTSGWL